MLSSPSGKRTAELLTQDRCMFLNAGLEVLTQSYMRMVEELNRIECLSMETHHHLQLYHLWNYLSIKMDINKDINS